MRTSGTKHITKSVCLAIAAVLALGFASCSKDKTTATGGQQDAPGVSRSGGGAELFDIADTNIKVTASDYRTNLTGDEAAAQKAKIPAEVRKGVGEIVAGLCTMTPDYGNTGTFKFGAMFKVPKDSYAEYWKVLTDYYKSLGGTVTLDEKVLSRDMLEIEFSWGTLYQCEGSEDLSQITVTFKINE